MKNLVAILKKRKYEFLLALIFLVGLLLRVQDIDLYRFSLWGYDEARDFLVANHISQYGEVIHRGPAATGGMGSLNNSVVYYYLIAFFWSMTRSPQAFSYLWLLIMSAQILIAYEVGKVFLKKKGGLVFALLVALSPELIYESKNLYQPYFLPLCSLLFLYFLGKRKKSILSFSSAVFFLLLPLHLHYGVLLILPFATLWLFYEWKKHFINKIYKKDLNKYVPFIIYILLLFFWVLATYTRDPFDQLSFFKTNTQSISFENFADQAVTAYSEFGKSIFRIHGEFLFPLSLVFIFWAIVAVVRSKVESSLTKYRFLFLLSIFCSALFAAFSKIQLYEIYFLSLLPFFLLMIVISFNRIYSESKFIGLLFLTIFSLVSIFLNNKVNAMHKYGNDAQMYSEIKRVSESIYSNVNTSNETSVASDNFSLSILAIDDTFYYDGWGTTPFWYFLESLFQSRLVVISDNSEQANIRPNAANIKSFFYICEHRLGVSENIEFQCLNKFYHNRDYLDKIPNRIYQSNIFSVWRVNALTPQSDSRYQDYGPDVVYEPYFN